MRTSGGGRLVGKRCGGSGDGGGDGVQTTTKAGTGKWIRGNGRRDVASAATLKCACVCVYTGAAAPCRAARARRHPGAYNNILDARACTPPLVLPVRLADPSCSSTCSTFDSADHLSYYAVRVDRRYVFHVGTTN